jgi:hypothetical protein
MPRQLHQARLGQRQEAVERVARNRTGIDLPGRAIQQAPTIRLYLRTVNRKFEPQYGTDTQYEVDPNEFGMPNSAVALDAGARTNALRRGHFAADGK